MTRVTKFHFRVKRRYAILTEKDVTKERLRSISLSRLRRQPEVTRLAKSRRISQKLRRLLWYRKAKKILCYVAFDGEVETVPILKAAIAEGRRVAVPVTRARSKRLAIAEIRNPKTDLKKRGPFGIPEPARPIRRLHARDLDLILVPGVAFDQQGRRLGRGGGYFDRFLEKLPRRIPRVGLAFRFQVVKKIPWELHDQPVDRVVAD